MFCSYGLEWEREAKKEIIVVNVCYRPPDQEEEVKTLNK